MEASKQTKTTMCILFCVLMALTTLDGIGLLFFAAAAAIYAVLWQHLTRVQRVLWLIIGLAIAYLCRCGWYMTFRNPSFVIYAALLLALALPLAAAQEKKWSRTDTILVMSVAFAVTLLGYGIAELYWHLGRNAMTVMWDYVAAWEDEIVRLLTTLPVEETLRYTEEDARLMVGSAKLLLPAVLGICSLLISYLTTALLRPIAQRTASEKALSENPYEITMSGTAAIIFLVTFILTVCLSLPINTFLAVLQNICALLTPGFCYIELRRLIFRIRNHQMDYFSWLWLVLIVMSAGYAFQYLALFGALHIIGQKIESKADKAE
jgi:hypothetical protein